jgi:hypothetical protein
MDRRETVYDGDDVLEVIFHDVTWEAVRSTRNQALAESDWRAVKDRVLPTAWKDYRSALRDLPQNHAESNDAADNWPVKPDE